MKLLEIIKTIESLAPLHLQESYDNSGLIIGNNEMEINKALITLDITEKTIAEAISKNANLIISHHPIIFNGLKKINGKNYIECCIIEAIKNDIAIYSAHTNLDNIIDGTNILLANKLKLKNIKPLKPYNENILKLVVFVPINHLEIVKKSIFNVGGGAIGNYDECSFSAIGNGSFRALENAKPFVGEKQIQHIEQEYKLETIIPAHLQNIIIEKMIEAHPYEEVAYELYNISQKSSKIGSGIIGDLEVPETEIEFLTKLKQITSSKCIKHSDFLNKKITKVAICGGSGASLIEIAKHNKADIYITADLKYHDFAMAENKIIIADIGHFESEQFSCELLFQYISKNLPTFALQISDNNINPINYL